MVRLHCKKHIELENQINKMTNLRTDCNSKYKWTKTSHYSKRPLLLVYGFREIQ